MITKEIGELLKGCRPVKDSNGNIVVQSILNMEIVCLTTDNEYSLDSRFENPMKSLVSSNSNYGTMSFRNNSDKEVIIPNQMAVITKQNAQDHGMVKGGYIGAKSDKTFYDAGCVEGSQPGYFSNTNEFRMMPLTMREMLFDVVGVNRGHDSIYPAIRRLGEDTQSRTQEYLHRYFDKYDKKLEQFIAHFEKPDKLIGMIVFVDGEILAIDKFPSFTYAEQVWDSIIRDCYGSVAIISELEDRTNRKLFTETFEDVKRTNSNKIFSELMGIALAETKKKITLNVEDKINELMLISFNTEYDDANESHDTIKSLILKSDGYSGQVLVESEFNHLVSIVRKERFNPNALRELNKLKSMARKQQRFGL